MGRARFTRMAAMVVTALVAFGGAAGLARGSSTDGKLDFFSCESGLLEANFNTYPAVVMERGIPDEIRSGVDDIDLVRAIEAEVQASGRQGVSRSAVMDWQVATVFDNNTVSGVSQGMLLSEVLEGTGSNEVLGETVSIAIEGSEGEFVIEAKRVPDAWIVISSMGCGLEGVK